MGADWVIGADGGLSGMALMLGASGFILELAILVFVALRIDAWSRRIEAKKLAARKAAELPLEAIANLLREIQAGEVEVIHSEHNSSMVDGEAVIGFQFRVRQLKLTSSRQWFGGPDGGKKGSAADHTAGAEPAVPASG
jgi:hypothetical protein